MSRPRSHLNTKTGVLDVRVSHAEELDGVMTNRLTDFGRAAGRAVSKARAAAMKMTRNSAQEMCHQIEHDIEEASRKAPGIRFASSTERDVYNDPIYPSVEWIRGDQHYLAWPAYNDGFSATTPSIRWGAITQSEDPAVFPVAAVRESTLTQFNQFHPVNIGTAATMDPVEPMTSEFDSRVPLPRSKQSISGHLWHTAEMDLRQCSENVLRATQH